MIFCILTFLTQLVIGFLYPLYSSLKLLTLPSLPVEEANKWLTYWIVLSILIKIIFPIISVFEFLETVLCILKTLIIVSLSLPQINASTIIYKKFIENNETFNNLKEDFKGKIKPIVEKFSCCLKN